MPVIVICRQAYCFGLRLYACLIPPSPSFPQVTLLARLHSPHIVAIIPGKQAQQRTTTCTEIFCFPSSHQSFVLSLHLLSRSRSLTLFLSEAGFFGLAQGGVAYFMMEFCAGGTVRDAIGRFPHSSLLVESRRTFWAYAR